MTSAPSNSSRAPGTGERALLSIRPSSASIVLAPIRSIVIFVFGFAVLWWYVPPSSQRNLGMAVLLGLLVARVIWQAIWVACAKYELTTDRVRATEGVFSRFGTEIPLARIQNTLLSQSLLERLAGVGTIGIASAGTGGVEIIWRMVDNPHSVLARVRKAADGDTQGSGLGDQPPPPARNHDSGPQDSGLRTPGLRTPGPKDSRPIILGLVGGIGAGKSTVARALESHGAIVLDSDTRAKAVLETPAARQNLIEWWGPEIIQDGKVDRKRIADIVFADPAQRRRLEALVHPLLKEDRQRDIAQAASRGVPIVVIDAPLLLEAGVDRECDAVVFVDAPRDQRVARVRPRGWDEAELDRREAAQFPLDQKRAKSQFVVVNDGDAGALSARVGELVARLTATGPR